MADDKVSKDNGGNVSVGLYQKHRPRTLKGLYGQESVLPVLKGWIDRGIPHVILLLGPTGCGKTTVARILRRKLNCSDMDFHEVNGAEARGIDTVRDIKSRMMLSPINGDCKVWLIDECHQLTDAAEDAFLKVLEDTPPHVYFFLASNQPNKIKASVHNRCKAVTLSPVKPNALKRLVLDVAEKEGVKLSEEVAERIAENAGDSPRAALSVLENVLWLPSEQEQIEAVQRSSVRQQGIDLARALMNDRVTWPEVAKILKDCEDDPEGLRHLVLSYANSCLLGKNAKSFPRAYRVIAAFRFNFYDSKKAGLSAACWEVVCGG